MFEKISLIHNKHTKFGSLFNANSDVVVLILGGSGILNEDGVANSNFRVGYQDWAKALQKKGFNAVTHNRYSSENALAECYKTSYAQTLKLEMAWAKALKQRFKRIFLLGHSLGGLLAMDIAAKIYVDGLILIGTPAEPFPQLLKRQLDAHSDAMLKHNQVQGTFIKEMNDDVLDYWLKKIPLSKIRHLQAKVAAKQQKQFIQTLVPHSGLDKIRRLENLKILILHGKLDTKVLWQDALSLKDNAPSSNVIEVILENDREHHLWRQNSSLALAIEDAALIISDRVETIIK